MTEVVTLQLGTFSVTIAVGSFVLTNSGPLGKFQFKGAIGVVMLSVEIQSLGSGVFKFTADGEGADLTGTMNPVTIVLTIGNDSGRTTVTAKLKY